MKGLFIVFEGGEFVGKTTQMRRLFEQLFRYAPVFTGEPWRAVTREGLSRGMLNAKDELALVLEDRRAHVQNVICPALKRGDIVMCERFSGSTFANYSVGRGIGVEEVRAGDLAARCGVQPDLVILLDADPVIVSERAAYAGDHAYFYAKGLEFHVRVRHSLLAQAYNNFQWRIINAERDRNAVFNDISAYFANILPPNPYALIFSEMKR